MITAADFYDDAENTRVLIFESLVRIGVIAGTEDEQLAHQMGWNAAIVHLATKGALKEDGPT